MIIAFVEDGTVKLHNSAEAAAAAYEGVDVESVVFFYRDDGAYLRPVFTTPNRYGRFLGVFRWSQSGTFSLDGRRWR